ncbi:MAG TPA: plastocyanin/azurin family copper-binding protein [Solirubrobacterales bacterium]|jgi:plastocyanin
MRRRLLTLAAAALGAFALGPAAAQGATEDVYAIGLIPQESQWDRTEVEIAVGDTVRWIFNSDSSNPPYTNQPHNVSVHPGVGTGNPAIFSSPIVVNPTNPPTVYQYTFDQEGVYTYNCSLHPGMQGTVTVGDEPGDLSPPTTTLTLDPAEPPGGVYEEGPVTVRFSATDGEGGSGVEVTEYRINGGDWVELENTEGDDPFLSEFTVTDDGEYTIAYRSRDAAGNTETSKYKSFQIGEDVVEPGVWEIFARDDGVAPTTNYFSPSVIEDATVGDTVRFRFNQASTVHNVWINPPDGGPYQLVEVANPGDPDVDVEAETAGVYAYYCTLHGGTPDGLSGMAGRVYVDTEPEPIVDPLPNDSEPPTQWEEDVVEVPVLSGVRATGLSRGVKIRLSSSKGARLTVKFVKVRPGKRKTVKTVRKRVKAGKTSFRVIDKKRLVGGVYRLRLVAVDGDGNRSDPVTVRTRVKY